MLGESAGRSRRNPTRDVATRRYSTRERSLVDPPSEEVERFWEEVEVTNDWIVVVLTLLLFFVGLLTQSWFGLAVALVAAVILQRTVWGRSPRP